MHLPKIKILGISGSIKQHATSHALFRHIAAAWGENIELTVFDNIGSLPHFSPDESDAPPAAVLDFRERILQADGLLFCTPEYVFSLPGSLKNAIEWTVSTTLFTDKPTAMIVAASSGHKAFESLDLILKTLQAVLPDSSKLLIQGAKGKIGPDGAINDEIIQAKIRNVVQSLLDSINKNPVQPT